MAKVEVSCPESGCDFKSSNPGQWRQHLVHRHDWRASEVAEWREKGTVKKSTAPPPQAPQRSERSTGETRPAAGGGETPPPAKRRNAVDQDFWS